MVVVVVDGNGRVVDNANTVHQRHVSAQLALA